MMKVWVIKETAQARFDVCKQCDRLNTTTFTCKECHCYMKWKVKLSNAECPLGKWKAEK